MLACVTACTTRAHFAWHTRGVWCLSTAHGHCGARCHRPASPFREADQSPRQQAKEQPQRPGRGQKRNGAGAEEAISSPAAQDQGSARPAPPHAARLCHSSGAPQSRARGCTPHRMLHPPCTPCTRPDRTHLKKKARWSTSAHDACCCTRASVPPRLISNPSHPAAQTGARENTAAASVASLPKTRACIHTGVLVRALLCRAACCAGVDSAAISALP